MNVTAQNLLCKRADRFILRDVTFSVNAGECLVLRGPNGAGKSTLLRVLAGLSSLAGGSLDIDPDAIAYAGHLDAIKSQLTVLENLQFWAGVYGTNSVSPTLKKLALEHLSGRAAHTLSAGQKRRLGLARLLLTERKIWLLDEPTVSLDRENITVFENIFADHLAQGGLLILSSHLDINIQNQKTLDISAFKPTENNTSQTEQNPFLEGTY